jgi:hypothetical protein
MFPIPKSFQETAISLYSSLDLAPNIVLSSRRTAPLSQACELCEATLIHGVKRQLAVVTGERDVVVVLCKMPLIFTNAEYAVCLRLLWW